MSLQTSHLFTPEELFTLKIDYKESTASKLKIIINYSDNKESDFFYLSPYEIVSALEKEIKLDSEIVYIGQSKNILQRFRKHSTILKAASKLPDNEELFLYFITFKVAYGGYKTDMKSKAFNLASNMDRANKSTYWSLITILERILIYFFQPIFNEMHMKTPIEEDKLIKSLLIKEGIEGIILETGVHGNFQSFWSPNQKIKEEIVSYKFNNSSREFISGIEDSFIDF